MNRKINIICFILLFFFLIGAVSAQDSENETLNQNIQSQDSPAEDLCQISVENDKLEENLNQEKALQSTAIAKEKVSLTASNVNMYYKDGSKFTVTLKDKNKKAIPNEKIKISLNGKTYSKTTDNKGTASLSLTLKSGSYSVLTSFDGTSKYSAKNVKSTIKIKSTIKSTDLKKIYKGTGDYTATFYDKKGVVLKSNTVNFKLNGKTYKVKTSAKGVAKLAINLNPGTYTITNINPKTTEQTTNTITVTPLITGNKDLTKYYKSTTPFKVKIINSAGKSAGSGKTVTFKLNDRTSKIKTDKNGYAILNFNLIPGTYTIKTTYGVSSVSNKITIKSLIETKNLKMTQNDGSTFDVKVLTSEGKASPNQKITFTVDSKSYVETTNANGIASLKINLEPGKYVIKTTYNDLKNSNSINIQEIVKETQFTYSVLIPNYVNVTVPYAYSSGYTIKNGVEGIIKMPKNEMYTVEVNSKYYSFTTSNENDGFVLPIGAYSYLIPFDGSGVQKSYNKDDLKGNGILIYKVNGYTEIDYVSNTTANIELFGVYMDKGLDNSEVINFMQNNQIMARVGFQTINYDELGVKDSISKTFGKTIYNINYNDLTKNDPNLIRFTNTNEPLVYSYFGSYIAGGYLSKEYIITKFKVNGKEEIEKTESISYGLDNRFNPILGFELLQSYAIINKKVTDQVLEDWAGICYEYFNRYGIMNVYGMFLASLQTTWLADGAADSLSEEMNIQWNRNSTLTIASGINLDNTFIHILNADMGMEVKGIDESDEFFFKFINSMFLPIYEEYAFSPIAEGYEGNTYSGLEDVFESIYNNDTTITAIGDIIAFNKNNSTMIVNLTTGIVNVLLTENDFSYKGSLITTSGDCCSVALLPKGILGNVLNTLGNLRGVKIFSDIFKNMLNNYKSSAHTLQLLIGPLSKAASTILPTLSGVLSPVTTMLSVTTVTNYVTHEFVEKKDWHYVYEHVSISRNSFLQGKQMYTIPNNKGGYDYVEVGINNDLSLNRNDAIYVSEGKVKQLTKAETYEYFDDESVSLIHVPKKYWKTNGN